MIHDPDGILNELQIKEIKTVMERFVSEKRVPERLVVGISRISGVSGRVTEDLLFSISGFVMTHKFVSDVHEVEFSHPSSPWEFFKEKYFSPNLKRRFPVRYNKVTKKVTIDRKAIFPFLNMEGSYGKIYIQEDLGGNNER